MEADISILIWVLFLQIGVMVLLALVVGAIFFGVKENMSGIQNRYGNMFIQFIQYFCLN